MLEWLMLAAVTGTLAGLLAGLLGIGGGLVLVPALYLLLPQAGVPVAYLAQTVLATAFALIIPAASSSVYSHHQRGSIDWRWCRLLLPWLAGAALVGAIIARFLPGYWLRLGFAVFLLWLAWGVFRSGQARAQPLPLGQSQIRLLAVLTGLLSSWLGIGGGSLLVPILQRLGLDLRQAVATSSACGLPIAVVACLGYVVVGWPISQNSSYLWGFVFWPAVLAIGGFSVLAAPWGARLAYHLPVLWLRRAFVLALLVVSAKMFSSVLIV